MAFKGMKISLAMVALTTLWAVATAQSSCTTAIISMSPCLSYITGNSSTASSSCCSQLANVVTSQPRCLCTLLNGGASSLGITLNQTRALALPGACNVQTPSVSQCNAAGGPTTPVAAPVEAPASPATPSTPSNTPVVPSTPSVSSTPESGSKTVPSTAGSTSNAKSTTFSLPFTFFLVFVASYASACVAF